MQKATGALWALSVFLFTATGSLLLVLFTLPFNLARSLLDRLSKDGSMDSFSLAFYTFARLPLLILALVLLGMAVLIVIFKKQTTAWAARLVSFPGRLWHDLRLLVAEIKAVRLSKPERLAFWFTLLLAFVARVPFLMRPYYHDEAYTVVTFAVQPFRELIGDYSMPNNHIFHTILVRLALLLFDIQPWAMRLPAMIAGILVVPASYFLARKLFNNTTAVIVAAFVAAMPVLVDYSTASRGYTLAMLFALLAFLLAENVRTQPNLAAWSALVVCVVLGLYTIPVFMAAFISVMLWLFLTWLIEDYHPAYARKQFFNRLIHTGVGVGLLTVLVYLPVFIRTGLQTDFTKRLTEPMSWEMFRLVMLSRIDGHFLEMRTELPPASTWIIVIGFGLSLLMAFLPGAPQAQARGKVPTQIALLGGTLALYTILRVTPETRMIVFLVPFWVLWAGAGWAGLVQWLASAIHQPRVMSIFIAAALVMAALVTGLRLAANPEANFQYRGTVENAALFLKSQVQENDLIVVNNPNDAATWYYTRLYGLGFEHFQRERPFFRTFIIVDTLYNQTLASVMEERGPDAAFFDFSTARVVYEYDTLQILELIPDENLIRSQYRLP